MPSKVLTPAKRPSRPPMPPLTAFFILGLLSIASAFQALSLSERPLISVLGVIIILSAALFLRRYRTIAPSSPEAHGQIISRAIILCLFLMVTEVILPHPVTYSALGNILGVLIIARVPLPRQLLVLLGGSSALFLATGFAALAPPTSFLGAWSPEVSSLAAQGALLLVAALCSFSTYMLLKLHGSSPLVIPEEEVSLSPQDAALVGYYRGWLPLVFMGLYLIFMNPGAKAGDTIAGSMGTVLALGFGLYLIVSFFRGVSKRALPGTLVSLKVPQDRTGKYSLLAFVLFVPLNLQMQDWVQAQAPGYTLVASSVLLAVYVGFLAVYAHLSRGYLLLGAGVALALAGLLLALPSMGIHDPWSLEQVAFLGRMSIMALLGLFLLGSLEDRWERDPLLEEQRGLASKKHSGA